MLVLLNLHGSARPIATHRLSKGVEKVIIVLHNEGFTITFYLLHLNQAWTLLQHKGSLIIF